MDRETVGYTINGSRFWKNEKFSLVQYWILFLNAATQDYPMSQVYLSKYYY
jgi:hypothetical protein